MSIVNVMAGIGSMIITNNRILLSQQQAQMNYERQQIVNRKNIEKKAEAEKTSKKAEARLKHGKTGIRCIKKNNRRKRS